MATWPLIIGGVIAQVETTNPAGRFVASWIGPDISQTTPQPQVGWTATETAGVWSFAPPPAPPAPSVIQQAAAAIAAGCPITSTGTPALDGTYAITPDAVSKVASVSLYVQVNGRFPAGQAQLAWPDMAGARHTFATTAQFQAFATALADYVAGLDLVIDGTSATLPAAPAPLA